MQGKEKSLRRSREPRNPFRLVGEISHDDGGGGPLERDPDQGKRRRQKKSSEQLSEQSDGEIGREAEFDVLERGSFGFVVLSRISHLKSRPVDVGGNSGVYIYRVDGVVESGDDCVSVLDLLDEETTQWRQMSEKEVKRLPEVIGNKLEKRDYVRATAVVDGFVESVVVLSLGWDYNYQNSADVLASMIRGSDGKGFTRAVYYYLCVFAAEAHSSPEALAQLKDIQPGTIQSELRKAETEWGGQIVDLSRKSAGEL